MFINYLGEERAQSRIEKTRESTQNKDRKKKNSFFGGFFK
jgi:hypothetical protein